MHRCIFKALANSDVLSADFSSPRHKSDGQNCVAPAMERFSSEFWCGGRRNTRVFQGRQAGNHRKSPMSGGTVPFHVCPCFLPRRPPLSSPRARLLRCLFPAHVREKTISYFDEETTGKACFLFVLLFRAPCGAVIFTLAASDICAVRR